VKALIQRVSQASVTVDDLVVGEIGAGILLFLGVEKHDSEDVALRLLDKVLRYRVFADEDGKMNKSLADVKGGLLVVSQFTLVAETRKGLRPSFSAGVSPEYGEKIYSYFLRQAKSRHANVSSGRFGADMKVALLNDGPVTFMLEI
jgi:D-tyrosyl-tRNA(Tyr) deacylase